MAFTYDLATSIGKVRFRLQDTREEGAFFSDAELSYIIGANATIDLAVADAARVCLAALARYARSFTGPDGAVDETAAGTYLQDLIDRYGGAELAVPTITVQRAGPNPSEGTFYADNVILRRY